MSIAGGMPEAIVRASAVEAGALQVFVKSSNQWAARPFAEGEVEAYRRASKDAGLDRYTLAHASYLINLASPDDALWEKSIAAFGMIPPGYNPTALGLSGPGAEPDAVTRPSFASSSGGRVQVRA